MIKLFSTVTTSSVLALGSVIPVVAQVIPDGTTSTTVDVDGTINNGDRAGGNLFHSFSEFSVPTGGQAFFNNSVDVVNIFSRVTGGNISNIDGILGANGTANLFLLNPAGIIFGENARLDIGGSFFGSTADSIIFSDGEFSALDTDNPPLLTINAPIGLNFRDTPADITVRGDGNGARLEGSEVIDTQDALRVGSDATIGLVGGNLIFEDATIKTAGGRIELGSVAGGNVNFESVDNGFALDYSAINNFRDITLSGSSNIDASGLGGGEIQVTGRNISITGVSGFSAITLGEFPGGDINIFASESLQMSGIENEDNFVSYLSTRIFPDGIADGGDINIETGSLTIGDRALIRTSVSGQGNAGDVNINATEGISLVSEGNNSAIVSNVGTDAIGNGGDINIITSSLTLNNGSFLNASTSGQGNAGNITISATESISLEGQDTTLGNVSILSFANSPATGNAGNIELTTGSLSLNNGALLATSSFTQTSSGNLIINATESVSFANSSLIFVSGADGGSLTINAQSLDLTSGSSFFGGVGIDSGSAEAQAGDIVINLAEDLVIDGIDSSNLTTINNPNFGTGNAGNIEINARNINFRNGGSISSFNNSEQGSIGTITLNATENIIFDGILNSGTSGIQNAVISNISIGLDNIDTFPVNISNVNTGDININANNLSIINGASVSTSISGNGNTGNINIDVAGTIIVDGSGENIPLASGITTSISNNGIGNTGDININTQNLFLSRNGQVNSSIFGLGNSGNININANVITIGEQGNPGISPSSISSNTINLFVNNLALDSNAGNISINTNSLSVNDGGSIEAGVNGIGNGGNIRINANENASVDGIGIVNDIEVFSNINSNISIRAVGNAGNLIINSPSLSVTNNAFISSDILGTGNSGNVEINTTELSVTNNSFISASIFPGGQGQAGSLTINNTESVELSGGSSISADISNNASGSSGNLFLQAENLTLADGSLISASTSGEGNAGSVTISVDNTIELIGQSEFGRTGLFANATVGGGDGGNLNIFTDNLILRDGAIVTASNFQSLSLSQPGSGNSGNVNINADAIVAFPNQNNDIIANALQGDGGNINIKADAILGIVARPQNPITNDIDASAQITGLDAIVNPLQGVNRLTTDPVSAETITTDACSAIGGKTNLIIKGKGGIPPEPKEPFTAEAFIPTETDLPSLVGNLEQDQENPNYIPENIKPIPTDNGDLYPARGIVKTADGKIILTAYPNPETTTRNLEKSLGCS